MSALRICMINGIILCLLVYNILLILLYVGINYSPETNSLRVAKI
jgi:hypothetical protein